jgi:hypothetical protein
LVLIPNKTGNSLWLLDEFLGEKRKPRPLEYSDTRQPGFSKIFYILKEEENEIRNAAMEQILERARQEWE